MSIRPFRDIKRNKTKVINVGPVKVGGNNPISVQSMTNTLTTDVNKTIKQIHQISEAGADIVRVSCPDENSTNALKEIVKHSSVPIIAHFGTFISMFLNLELSFSCSNREFRKAIPLAFPPKEPPLSL